MGTDLASELYLHSLGLWNMEQESQLGGVGVGCLPARQSMPPVETRVTPGLAPLDKNDHKTTTNMNGGPVHQHMLPPLSSTDMPHI